MKMTQNITKNQFQMNYSQIFDRMLSKLSGVSGNNFSQKSFPLYELTTRERDDPIVAFLDAWAVTLDVLSFYQRRYDEENYIHTAQEERSIYELSKSVGYTFNPGISASVLLNFTLEKDREKLIIAKGTQLEHVPENDELSQTFETDKGLLAQFKWNCLKPYQLPQIESTFSETGVAFQGIGLGLKVGDVVLLMEDETAASTHLRLKLRKITETEENTYVEWEKLDSDSNDEIPTEFNNPLFHVFRERMACFGHNAPRFSTVYDNDDLDNWDDNENKPTIWRNSDGSIVWEDTPNTAEQWIYLDRVVEKIVSESFVLVVTDNIQKLYQVVSIKELSIADFGMSARVTALKLSPVGDSERYPHAFTFRNTSIYVQSEALQIYEHVIEGSDNVIQLKNDGITLDTIIPELPFGRTLIISDDVHTESFSVLGSANDESNKHTKIKLNDNLKYSYLPKNTKIYANVVLASHGMSVNEVLGSGDARRANQRFELRRKPLTYLPANSDKGIKNTLEVWVNEVRWNEVSSLRGLSGSDQVYYIDTDMNAQTVVVFGDGIQGARLPSGEENVRAVYRVGIGSEGEVLANSISLFKSKPPGVADVTNPLVASGAGIPETADSARRNAPLHVVTIDRIVSLRDYEYFALSFAGIGKVYADIHKSGHGSLVFLTITGNDGDAINEQGVLYKSLVASIRNHVTLGQAFQIKSVENIYFNLKANILIQENYNSKDVCKRVTEIIQNEFSFYKRNFAQNIYATDIINVIQNVSGVKAVDLDALYYASPDQEDTEDEGKLIANASRVDKEGNILPAELLTVNPAGITIVEDYHE